MDNRLTTLKDFLDRHWTPLLKRHHEVIVAGKQSANNSGTVAVERDGLLLDKEDNTDPFDCSDLAILDVFGHVDKMMPSWIQRWRHLDDRKIAAPLLPPKQEQPQQQEGSAVGSDDNKGESEETDSEAPRKRQKTSASARTSTTSPPMRKTKKPTWFAKHVRLPHNFDYKSQQTEPPPKQALVGQDCVVSLEDPTQKVSYEHELWHLFHSVPTSHQIEADLTAGMVLPRTRAAYQRLVEGSNSSSTAALGNSSEQEALHALRMSDRHDLPLAGNNSSFFLADSDVSDNLLQGTMTFELWSRPMNRRAPPTPDSARLVLEFLGSQTLLDVHCAIVDLRQDDFWNEQVVAKAENKAASNCSPSDHATNQGGGGEDRDIDVCSGLFLIEDTCYITGSQGADYADKIQTWLSAGNKRQQAARAGVGLTPTTKEKLLLEVRCMSQVALENLPVRLGTRYAHWHHGNVESALFVVDLQCHLTGASSSSPMTTPFPRIHDVWAPTVSAPQECEACQRRLATMATSTRCQITDGHRLLCQVCVLELFAKHQSPTNELQKLAVWHNNAAGSS